MISIVLAPTNYKSPDGFTFTNGPNWLLIEDGQVQAISPDLELLEAAKAYAEREKRIKV